MLRSIILCQTFWSLSCDPLTYVEYRAVSGVFQNIDPPPPLHPASVSSPCSKGWGYTDSPGGEGVGGSIFGRRQAWGGGAIFWKTPDIGLASYSIIPLRFDPVYLYCYHLGSLGGRCQGCSQSASQWPRLEYPTEIADMQLQSLLSTVFSRRSPLLLYIL
jgi:hypothetical protein